LQNRLREFVLVGGAAPAGEIPQAASSGFGITDGPKPRTLRRTWLDTFDWRLYLAGLTLEYRAGRGTAELILTGRDGELVAAERTSGPSARAGHADGPHGPDGPHVPHGPDVPRWPCLVGELPLGPLREHLTPVIGVRALLPVARATSVLTERRAVNSDDKTVATLTVDRMAVTYPRRATVPARLSVSALRGYQAQASRLADSLAAGKDLAAAIQGPFEAALAAAGRKPGDYSSKIDVRLTASMPASLALVTVLGRLFDTVEANRPGALRDVDTEFLHDLRVAVRRTRSVLKTGGSVLPASLTSRYRPEFKWLGDLTTPTRDLDVYLLGYPAMEARLVAATAGELRPFRDHLARQRAQAQRELSRGLRSARFTRLASQWRELLAQIAAAPGRRPQAGRLAARQIARAHRRVLADGGAITPASAPQSLHDLRKRCKELRYLLEIFASLHDPAEQWQAVNQLKSLQDCLGEFQDTEVQQAELRSFAGQMMADRSAPAATLLAMGEIAAALAVRQQRARAEFGGRFAEFAGPQGVARIGALTATSR
jgi:CHAD domain-containing protein